MVFSLFLYSCRRLLFASARGPGQAAPGQHMEVQVRHALAAVLPNIGNDTVAVFVYAEVLAQPGDDRKHMAKQRRVRLAQCGRRSDMPLGITRKWDRACGSMS